MFHFTEGGGAENDIREIAGRAIVVNGDGGSVKTLYFAGDFVTPGGVVTHALWRVNPTHEEGSFVWTPPAAPEFVDLNGTGGAVPLNPTDLTLSQTPEGERLFLFGMAADGNGQIISLYDDHFAGTGNSTGSFCTHAASGLFDAAIAGGQIRPWEDGVVFSGIADPPGASRAFVATWSDPERDGAFVIDIVFEAGAKAAARCTRSVMTGSPPRASPRLTCPSPTR